MKCVEEGRIGVLKVVRGAETVVSILYGDSKTRQDLTVSLGEMEGFCCSSEMCVVRREKEQKRLFRKM